MAGRLCESVQLCRFKSLSLSLSHTRTYTPCKRQRETFGFLLPLIHVSWLIKIIEEMEDHSERTTKAEHRQNWCKGCSRRCMCGWCKDNRGNNGHIKRAKNQDSTGELPRVWALQVTTFSCLDDSWSWVIWTFRIPVFIHLHGIPHCRNRSWYWQGQLFGNGETDSTDANYSGWFWI